MPISIGIPVSLMMRLDDELDWQQSRSRWVKSAILGKLDAHSDESQVISSLSDMRLLTILFNRHVINWEMYEAIKARLLTLDDS